MTEILWVDCNHLDPPPPIPIFIEGNEKMKQNKIKILRYLTETKL